MSRNSVLFFMLGLCLLLILSCGKGRAEIENVTVKDAVQLLQRINAAPMGVEIAASQDKIAVESVILPDGGDGFKISIKEPKVVFDTSVYRYFDPNIAAEKIPIKMEELRFLYGPADDFLALDSIKRLEFDWDMSRWVKNQLKQQQKAADAVPKLNMKVSLGEAKFQNYNYSALLKPGDENFFRLLVRMLEDNPHGASEIRQMRIEFTAAGQDKKNFEFTFSMDNLESRYRVKPDFIAAFFDESADLESIPRMLAGGFPFFEIYGKLSNFSYWVKMAEKELTVGNLGQTDFSYYLRPDESREFFDYGFFFNMKELRTTIPDDPVLELAANFRELNLNFSIGHLSPALIQSYIQLTRAGLSKELSDDQARRQALIARTMKIGGEFMKTKPVFKMSVLPWRHYLGELNAQGSFRFPGDRSWPAGMASVMIKKVDDVIKGVKREDSLSGQARKEITEILQKYFVKDDDGNGKLNFEIQPGTPGAFLLNGQPVK